jgi:hypothetical protein
MKIPERELIGSKCLTARAVIDSFDRISRSSSVGAKEVDATGFAT